MTDTFTAFMFVHATPGCHGRSHFDLWTSIKERNSRSFKKIVSNFFYPLIAVPEVIDVPFWLFGWLPACLGCRNGDSGAIR